MPEDQGRLYHDPAARPLAPASASRPMQGLINASPYGFWDTHLETDDEWRAWRDELATRMARGLPSLRDRLGVRMERAVMAGVPVFMLTPSSGVREELVGRVLLHVHAGGFLLQPGESGTLEATYMAARGWRVVSVDYRLLPDHPFPAALEDTLAVYRRLLEAYPAGAAGVFGSSAGGLLTLTLPLRARHEGLSLPGALGAGSPMCDMIDFGDTAVTHEGLDNVLVSLRGWLGYIRKRYAAGYDFTDPLLSPIYGDVRGFPPTMLTSGTRDLFLSSTARMHLKLRAAGVAADLMVFEGLSHIQYYMSPSAPETGQHFDELSAFFRKHLAGGGR